METAPLIVRNIIGEPTDKGLVRVTIDTALFNQIIPQKGAAPLIEGVKGHDANQNFVQKYTIDGVDLYSRYIKTGKINPVSGKEIHESKFYMNVEEAKKRFVPLVKFDVEIPA